MYRNSFRLPGARYQQLLCAALVLRKSEASACNYPIKYGHLTQLEAPLRRFDTKPYPNRDDCPTWKSFVCSTWLPRMSLEGHAVGVAA